MYRGNDVIISESAEFRHPDGVEIRDHCAIDYGFYCTTALYLGGYNHISSHVSVIGGASGTLVLRDFAYISTGSRIIVRSDKMLGDGIVGPVVPDKYKDRIVGSKTVFESFAGVGANSVVLPDVRLHQGAVLGANSMLTQDAEPWTIYVGSPARPIKQREKGRILEYAEELTGLYYGN